MIARARRLHRLAQLSRQFPVVALVGARQVGKSTLAREFAGQVGGATFFDLEDPRDLARLSQPMLALDSLRGLVILDEIQRRPDLFPVLRVLADRPRRPARFLILGSASGELLHQSSESLAGRIAYQELAGFSLDEVGARTLGRLWLRGGFPSSFVARGDGESARWREEFVRTFLERDLPSLGLRLSAEAIHRFWRMLAHWHGQLWNGAEFARAFGVSEKTVRHYLDVLAGTFVVQELQPWHENLAKRQVKSPKVYVADSGLLHSLLGLPTLHALRGHPKVGASWEGFAIRQIIERLGTAPGNCYFWALHSGAELDLLIVEGGRRRGFEVKYTDSPELTPSMRSAVEQLRLDSLHVLTAGTEGFPLAKRVTALPVTALWEPGALDM